jgi:hypothetical protein
MQWLDEPAGVEGAELDRQDLQQARSAFTAAALLAALEQLAALPWVVGDK